MRPSAHTSSATNAGRYPRRYRRYYALKIIKKTYVLLMSQLEHIKSEVKLLRLLQHPFIVTLQSNFQDELRLYLLMELVIGGELYALLRNAGKFHNDRAKYYASEVVLVLESRSGAIFP